MTSSSVTSYCGPPPLPAELLARWNLDPWLLAALAGALIFGLAGRRSPQQRVSFAAGLGVLAIIFVSPLCALTVALFSARVVHHVMLVAVAAPLLAWALIGSRPALSRLPQLLTPLLVLHTVIFWLWHAPDFYALALDNTAVYWLMQLSLLGSAFLFWAAVLLASPARAVMALVAVAAQMGLLAALLVFSGHPLYAPHFTTTSAFGLDPVSDQQLAGLIMWAPANIPYLVVLILRLFTWLRRSEVPQA